MACPSMSDLINCLSFGSVNRRRTERIDNAFRSVEEDRLTLVDQEAVVAAQLTRIRAINTMHMDDIVKAGGPESRKPGIALMMSNFHESCHDLKKKAAELSDTTARRVQMDVQLKHLHDRVNKARQGNSNNGSLTLLYKMLPSIDTINDQNDVELEQLERMKEVVAVDRDHERDKTAITLDDSDEVELDNTDNLDRLNEFITNIKEREQVAVDSAMSSMPLPNVYQSASTGVTVSSVLLTSSSVYESSSTPTATKYTQHLDGDIDTH